MKKLMNSRHIAFLVDFANSESDFGMSANVTISMTTKTGHKGIPFTLIFNNYAEIQCETYYAWMQLEVEKFLGIKLNNRQSQVARKAAEVCKCLEVSKADFMKSIDDADKTALRALAETMVNAQVDAMINALSGAIKENKK